MASVFVSSPVAPVMAAISAMAPMAVMARMAIVTAAPVMAPAILVPMGQAAFAANTVAAIGRGARSRKAGDKGQRGERSCKFPEDGHDGAFLSTPCHYRLLTNSGEAHCAFTLGHVMTGPD